MIISTLGMAFIRYMVSSLGSNPIEFNMTLSNIKTIAGTYFLSVVVIRVNWLIKIGLLFWIEESSSSFTSHKPNPTKEPNT